MKDLANYKKEIHRRIGVLVVLVVLALLALLFSNFYLKKIFPDQEGVNDFVVGFFTGLELIPLVYMGVLGRALKDEDRLKKMYLKETDEREILIRMKSGVALVPFLSMVLVVASLVVAYISYAAFVTLMVVALIQILVSLGLKVYWSHKI
ncbi:MAG: hypothetical protein Q4E37_06180 [Tissierellia bacterium]|nr:hypothetical protein [Tissierellia bacterium]